MSCFFPLGGRCGIYESNCPKWITVMEDVSAKIMSFSQHGSRAVCILSAKGAISNVTLRQAATLGGTVSYELTEASGQHNQTGGLSVSLAGLDGRVLGGGVAGILTVASPVQVQGCRGDDKDDTESSTGYQVLLNFCGDPRFSSVLL